MAAWERRRLARSGRVLALVYGGVLALACAAFALLTVAADEPAGGAGIGDSIPALLVISVCGVGAVGCASMGFDRRIPPALWLVGLVPALITAVVLLVA